MDTPCREIGRVVMRCRQRVLFWRRSPLHVVGGGATRVLGIAGTYQQSGRDLGDTEAV